MKPVTGGQETPKRVQGDTLLCHAEPCPEPCPEIVSGAFQYCFGI